MSTQTIHEDATHIGTPATTDLKLEVDVIPVSDVDRANRFYEGWAGGRTPISRTVTIGDSYR